MFYLTIGPFLNLIGYFLFVSKSNYVNFTTMSSCCLSESFELFGIILLDVSMIDDLNKNWILVYEIFGFINLCYASVLEFSWNEALFSSQDVVIHQYTGVFANNVYKYIPYIKGSFDWVDGSEFIGLLILMTVSFHHYSNH